MITSKFILISLVPSNLPLYYDYNYYLQGKSTFYNAATCAALRGSGGRNMAEVAPHPFTTIEPNIGPGWFAGPRDSMCDKGRTTAYGRDSTDRRLLPVMVKDVAGLVPGAYKGRGKGTV